jgi:hypothetical protein
MEAFINEIIALVTEYGVTTNSLLVTLAIEVFQDKRNYPKSYTEDIILSDLAKNKSKIAYAVIEADAKIGQEGETSHTEIGMSRNYKEVLMKIYGDVIGFISFY